MGFETYLGKDPKTGKDIRTKRRRFKSKAEAQTALNRLLVDFKEKQEFKINVTTFQELYELWIDNYRTRVNRLLLPLLNVFARTIYYLLLENYDWIK